MPPRKAAEDWIKFQRKNYPQEMCGPGSNYKNTRNIVAQLPEIINELELELVIDAGCGQFTWMKEVLEQTEIRYIGLDVDDTLLNANRAASEALGHRATFIKAGIQDLPKSLPEGYPALKTAIMARDVLIHDLPENIPPLVESWRGYAKYLLTTHISRGTNKPKKYVAIDDWVYTPTDMNSILGLVPLKAIPENQAGKFLHVYEL